MSSFLFLSAASLAVLSILLLGYLKRPPVAHVAQGLTLIAVCSLIASIAAAFLGRLL